MPRISIEMSHALVAMLQGIVWEEIDEVGVQELIGNPELARTLFAEFIDRGVPSDVLTVSKLIQRAGKNWRINENPHGLKKADGEFDRNRVGFTNLLLPSEPFLRGSDLIERLRGAGEVCFGIEAFLRIWNDRANLPKEWECIESGEQRTILFVADELIRNGHGPSGSAFIALNTTKTRWEWSPYDADGKIIRQMQVATFKAATPAT